MKKAPLILCTAALVCMMNFPVFAAETKSEYKNEAAQIRQELENTGKEIKSLKAENKAVSDACKAAKKAQKEAGKLKENKEMWKQVNALKDNLENIHVSYVEADSQVKVLKAKTRQDAKDKKYDEALSKLNQALEQKKDALDSARQMNEIWDQIEELIK